MKFGFQEKIDEKQLKWQQIGHEIENIKDRLGRGIDENIKSVVISLKANNFGTAMSCEGHLDRAYPWPWVNIVSPLSEGLLSDQRYIELEDESRVSREEGKIMPEKDSQELEFLIKKQKEENEKECQRLQGILTEFYTLQSEQNNKNSNDNTSLGIWKVALNQSRLQPNEAPKFISPLESQKISSNEEKEKKLMLYRQEMDKFAEFLKNKFFNKK